MDILVLNGSPRKRGGTRTMVNAFAEGAEGAGHTVRIIDVCDLDVHGCRACEFCHGRGSGRCAQHDDMDAVYEALDACDMLVLASPIYYHGMSGQLKCVVDRFYAKLYPFAPARLQKVAMILCSGDPDMYEGARFSYEGDFTGYLGLEGMGVLCAYGQQTFSPQKLAELRSFGAGL